MKNLIDEFREWVLTFFIGEAPVVDNSFCVTGTLSAETKRKISINVSSILQSNKKKHYKFGVTGDSEIRTDQNDYRKADYKTLFILFKSRRKESVFSLEVYYIKKVSNDKYNDNNKDYKVGRMRSYNGYFYLYMVV